MSVKTSRHFTPTKDVVTATSPREQQIRALCEANGVTAAQREAAEAEVAGTRANMLLNRFSEERLKAVVARMSSGLPLTGAQIVEFFDTIMARTPGGYRPKRVAAASAPPSPALRTLLTRLDSRIAEVPEDQRPSPAGTHMGEVAAANEFYKRRAL